MKSAAGIHLVLVTAPDLRTARRLAKSALSARLAACVNLMPKVESHYWWQGKLQSGPEVLLIFKTPEKHLAMLEKLLLAQHPYDTPEFLVLLVHAASEKYLAWLKQSCQ